MLLNKYSLFIGVALVTVLLGISFLHQYSHNDAAPIVEPLPNTPAAIPTTSTNSGTLEVAETLSIEHPAPVDPVPQVEVISDSVADMLDAVAGVVSQVTVREQAAQRVQELQPTLEELYAMNSPELIGELLGSPLQVSIFHSSDLRVDRMFNDFALNHRGVDILLSRTDAAALLLDTYQAQVEVLAEFPHAHDAGRPRSSTFITLETLMSADVVLDQLFVEDKLPALIEAAELSVVRREETNAAAGTLVYGDLPYHWSQNLVRKALQRLRASAE